MKLPIIGILSSVALSTFSGVAQAAIVIPPTGLAPGSEYRLVFVTSGTRDATSSNIADYNTFVQNAAQSSSVLNTALTAAGFDPTSISWTAIASTSAVNARVNTQTQATDTSRPIYRLDGAQVATDYTDLWDRIEVPIRVTEGGLSPSRLPISGVPTGCCVWTGTDPIGQTTDRPLGAATVTAGLTSDGGGSWVFNAFGDSNLLLRVYGISSVLAVPTATTTTTPEPSSLLGFITLGGLLLGGVVRKARK